MTVPYDHFVARSLTLAPCYLTDLIVVAENKVISVKRVQEGKHHRSSFSTGHARHSKGVLDLVNSDVCGKMNTQPLRGAEYFLTFVDNKTHYMCMYVLSKIVKFLNDL